MRTSLIFRFAGGLLLSSVAGCGGEELLLPGSGAPAGLNAVSGDRQEAPAGAPLPQPLVVQATDGSGRPVPDALISFSFDGDVGGVAAPATARTNPQGLARADVRLGTAAGTQLVDASVVDGPAGLLVTFRLNALARPTGPGGDGGSGGGDDGGNSGNGGSGGNGGGVDDGGNGGGGGGGGGVDGGGGGNDDGGGGGAQDGGKGGKGKDKGGKDGKGGNDGGGKGEG